MGFRSRMQAHCEGEDSVREPDPQEGGATRGLRRVVVSPCVGWGGVWTTRGHAARTPQGPSGAAWDRFLAEFRAWCETEGASAAGKLGW